MDPTAERRVFQAVDWSRCVIGGSYALRAYTGARDWQPDDVDIMCAAESHSEFREILDAFIAKSGPHTELRAIKLLTEEDRRHAQVAGREERFHESILGTSTLHVPGVALFVQLVGFQPSTHQHGRGDIVTHLSRITDLPACVSLTARPGEEPIFHVPQRALVPLATRRIPVADICAARKTKYERRGYTFF